MNKTALRKLYKEKRQTLDQDTLEELSIHIANQALRAKIWHNNTFHLFLPIAKHREVDTTFLLTAIQGKDKNVVISRSNFADGSMKHYLLTDSTSIKNNSFGIPEPVSGIEIAPTELDVVFVPLLAFDRSGNRVGYGKGFYDRFLNSCRKDTLKIGVSFFEPVKEISDLDEYDIPLDMCITPDGIFDFRN
ncbi:5-formyltetrahydrofolate cyclo-ligase [Robertkochia flava]|uniref:5-formyltetrahydrofolate cyclo-ligase n=1 Tax=Robertkochia flava TaxID=3447986 RepID=UPI001CCD5C1C|nr:5-formyltetrahydrofolate cyclo-ligase [Robertkochia marina]